MTDMTYRKELDGLRAIAVLAVVLFHVGYPDMTGGYVGVDIFFVLSGFLICGQTYLRLEAGTYSVTDFFARRIRRLAAAYGACFLVIALLANWFFLRSEMQVVADGFLGSITFTNNFNLLNSTGYFAGPAHEDPFLHTWSLSIEEQFYIVLPILILLLQRSRIAFIWLLVGLFAVSLALALFSGDLIYNKDQRYFSSSFRVWQLAAGGLAFLAIHHKLLPRRIPLLPLVGLGLVLAPINLLDASYLYPGWAALLPVAGTVILVLFAAPEHSWTGRALATRPMAYIGRISYGTYLWHWPVILGALYYGVVLTDEVRAIMVLAALVLGAISYHLIETPVRRIPISTGKRWLFGAFAVQCAVMLGVAAYLHVQPGKAESEEGAQLAALKAQVGHTHEGWSTCWSQSTPDTFCQFGDVGDAPDFMLWGDSIANSAFWAFEDYAEARGQVGYLATSPGCAPLVGVGRNEDCVTHNDAVLAYLETAPPMDVFLMARWTYYTTQDGDLIARLPNGSDPKTSFPNVEAGLSATLERIGDRHRVTVINMLPEFYFNVPKGMLREMRFGTVPPALTREQFDARSGAAIEAVQAVAERQGVRHMLAHDLICDDSQCAHEIDGVPVYFDDVHLGELGNELLAERLLKITEVEN